MSKNKIVCIAGASGLVGSHLVKECLKRGYKVRGTLTDATNKEKTKHLMELNNAKENLQLFSADMYEENSFDKVLKGVDAFFIACYVPVVKLKDGTSIKQLSDLEVWEKVLGPTKKATLNLLNSSKKNNVENLFICSSTATVNPPYPVEHKIEDIHFTLLQDQIEQKKYTPAQKTILESVARNFVKSSKQRLCIFLPTIMIGPVLMPQHLENEFMKLLNNYVKGEDHGWHKEIPSGSMSIAHISDVAKLFVNAYEDESASGRYVAVKESWTWKKIYNELAKYVDKDLLPKDNGVVPDEVTKFDTSKQDKLDVEMTSVAETIEETVKFLKERS